MSSTVKMPERPEPDGFLTIKIIGRSVEVNAYRDSTLEAYAAAYADARVAEALERAAEECDGFASYYMYQARGGDQSGASDHKADAATDIAEAIRALKEQP